MNLYRVLAHPVWLLGLLVIANVACDSGSSGTLRSTPSPERNASSSSSPSKQWFQGGTLQRATIAEWKDATYQNKLATATDFLAATKWSGHLNSLDDFDKLKVKAMMLVMQINQVVEVAQPDSMTIAQISVAITNLGLSLIHISEPTRPY